MPSVTTHSNTSPLEPVLAAGGLVSPPALTPSVYGYLPRGLQALGEFFEDGSEQGRTERAVFTIGALPVLAGICSAGAEFAHADRTYSPDLYVCAVARPGSGKGALSWSRRLGAPLDMRLRETSEWARSEWEQEDKKIRDEKPPAYRSYYVSGRASVSGLIAAMQARGGRACIFEEEIDTIAGTLGQEWGDYSDILRKGFHHEPVGTELKNERVHLSRPSLSVCLSGTGDQFRTLFGGNVENGLFSRFGFYRFESEPAWRSHRPRARHDDR